MARRPKNAKPPFEVGDTIKPRHRPLELPTSNIYLTVRKISYVGKRHCESGWLVQASDGAGKYKLKGYDSKWFRKV